MEIRALDGGFHMAGADAEIAEAFAVLALSGVLGDERFQQRPEFFGAGAFPIEFRQPLSREAAARSIQISTSAWLSYETGQRIPSLSVAFRISRLLGMAVDELFYYPESHNM